jgi:hypothetical protein
MQPFDANQYGPIIAELLADPRLPALGPGSPNLAVRPRLQHFDLDRAFAPHRIIDRDMALSCLAGLWLLHDFLDESHRISQDIDTPTGSYWHGIMHRREPDASNAKYWFRRVGSHPTFPRLATAAGPLGLALPGEEWNPFDFIDWCEEQRGTGSDKEMLLRKVQLREWELLFDWCFAHAVGVR